MAEVDFSSICIWVQIHELSMGKTTRHVVSQAAAKIGDVMEINFRSHKNVSLTQFVRVKVKLLVTRPLSSGFFMECHQREPTWIQF